MNDREEPKISDSISRPDSKNNEMPSNSNKPAAPAQEQAKSSTGRRLIAAAALIGLAIVGLALVDRLRERPAGLTPPHEPSEALITPPAAEPNVLATKPDQPITPPPAPKIINNETLAPPSRAASSKPLPQAALDALAVGKTVSAPGRAYLVQVGVFASPANAQALQNQLQRAGIEAHLETRVQIGPFKDKREADKAMARARKLGINAVLVGLR